jgi:hypothetical protein
MRESGSESCLGTLPRFAEQVKAAQCLIFDREGIRVNTAHSMSLVEPPIRASMAARHQKQFLAALALGSLKIRSHEGATLA